MREGGFSPLSLGEGPKFTFGKGHLQPIHKLRSAGLSRGPCFAVRAHPLAPLLRNGSSLRSSGNLTASPQVHLALTRPDAFISPGRQAVREAEGCAGAFPLHCSALFNHGQATPFIVYIAAFGRFVRRSRIPKRSCRHIYSRCEVRSCGAGMHRSAAEGRFGEAEPAAMTRPQVASRSEVARGLRASVCAGARTLGDKLSENAFKEMPTLADKSSDFGFSSGIQVYFWTQRSSLNCLF